MKIFAPLNNEPQPTLQQIEVATFFQLPSFQIIGLPSPEVAEARERIRSAIEASGIEFPKRRVILNLSPASVRKRGTGLDLGMALAVLCLGRDEKILLGAWGELGLNGSVKSVGQLTRTIYASWKGHLTHLMIPKTDFEEAHRALVRIQESGEFKGDAPILVPVSTLIEAWELISAGMIQRMESSEPKIPLETQRRDHSSCELSHSLLPLSPSLERIVGVAVAGAHHSLLLGPRGTGKSHALEWMVAVHPPISPYDRLKQILLAELGACNQRSTHLVQSSPIRRVSAQVKPSALIGGASPQAIRPGEFSLAHGGILIADEFPEWHHDSREALREPLERYRVTLTRTHGSVELPAQFLFAANGNLCPCGGWPPELPAQEGKGTARCKCVYSLRKAYLSRLSGPILDRIDLVSWVTTPPGQVGKISEVGERLRGLQEKVVETRRRLTEAWGKLSGHLQGAEVEDLIQKHGEWTVHLSRLPAVSLRSRHKIVRLALSLAAWDGSMEPEYSHFIEGSCYRPEKMNYLQQFL